MPKFHLISDLHLEHEGFEFPEVDADYLCIAGDFGGLDYYDFLDDVAPRYKKVFVVMGNHDYYDTDGMCIEEVLHGTILRSRGNVILLRRNQVYHDKEEKFTIIGDTLWTDFNNKNPLAMGQARIFMPDYRGLITTNEGEQFTPEYSTELHLQQKDMINTLIENTKSMYPDHKIIVMTHHMPSDKLTSDKYKGNDLNPAFSCKDMEDVIEKVDYWFMGHSHEPFNGRIPSFDCEFYCNPRGYPFEDTGFNPELVIEVK